MAHDDQGYTRIHKNSSPLTMKITVGILKVGIDEMLGSTNNAADYSMLDFKLGLPAPLVGAAKSLKSAVRRLTHVR